MIQSHWMYKYEPKMYYFIRETISFIVIYSCNVSCIFSSRYSSLSVTWSLRNNFNIPIFGSRNISYYYYEDLQYINLVYMFYKPDLYNVYQGVSASSLISTNGVLGQKKVEDPGCWRLKIREKCLCPVFVLCAKTWGQEMRVFAA